MTAAPQPTNTGSEPARLIATHQPGIWRYLRVLGCEPSLAEDLTQETFLAVLQHPFKEINPVATAAYLRKTARNLFISHCRRAGRVLTFADVDVLDRSWTRWAGDDQGEELLEALRECLVGLSDRARRALDLRFRDRCSRNEIAAALELTEDGAKNLLQRAKHQLRDCINSKLK